MAPWQQQDDPPPEWKPVGSVKGPPGPPGPTGPAGPAGDVSLDDMPSLTLLFENGLI